MRVFHNFDQVRSCIGEVLGVSEWLAIDQERVNQFADTTGDHQWVHLDAERAKSGPFGATIAHGYLTLALLPLLSDTVFAFETPGPKLNYGLDRVRFPAPVRVGAQIRSSVLLLTATERDEALRVVLRHTVEVEGQQRPGCVADAVVLLLPTRALNTAINIPRKPDANSLCDDRPSPRHREWE